MNNDNILNEINENDIALMQDFKESVKIYKIRKQLGFSFRRFRRLFIPKKSRRAV